MDSETGTRSSQPALAPPSRALLTAGAVMNTFVYAIIVFIIGVSLPTLTEKFELNDAQKGTLFLVQNLALFLTIVSSGPLMDRLGRKVVLVVGALLIAAGVVGMGVAPTYGMLLVSLFVLGLGGGCNNVGGSTLISDLYPENPGRALNWITSSFGVGAITIPLLSALLLEDLSYPGYVSLLGVVALIPFVLFVFSRFPAVQQEDRIELRNMLEVMLNPLAVAIGAVLFFYVALEVSTAGWLKDFFMTAFDMTDSTSGFVLTGFSVMLVVGRLVGGVVLERVQGSVLIIGCAVLALLGLVLMILSGNVVVAVVGVGMTGLAFAPVYPTALGLVGENVTRYLATTIGVVSALGFLGAVVLPYLIGLLGGNLNVMIAGAVLLIVSQFVVIRLLRRRRAEPAAVRSAP